MIEIYSTSDMAQIAFVKSLLQSASLEYVVFDEHTSGLFGGFADCRIMLLDDDDYDAACELLFDAGLEPSAPEGDGG
jgi:hypothetical protein